MSDPWIPDRADDNAAKGPAAGEVLYQDHGFDEVLPADWSPDGAEWPPPVFATRDRIFARLKALRGGNLGLKRTALGASLVSVNEFARYSRRTAAWLALGRPTAGGELIGSPLCIDWVDDQTVYGGAVVTHIDGALGSIEPGDWYPRADGGHVTGCPYYSGAEDHADRIEIAEWHPDGQVLITQLGYDGRTKILAADSEDQTAGRLEVAPAPPQRGHTRQWGSTVYFEMFPLVLEIARRLSRNSVTFDLYARPIPVFDQSMKDARARFDIDDDTSDDDAREEILAGYQAMLAELSIHLPGDILKVAFLQPHVQGADYALNTVKELRDMLREIAGVPDLTGRTLSGEALKRLYGNFYAESDGLLESLAPAVEDASGLEVEWPHPFDSGAFSASPTGPPPASEETVPQGAADGAA